MKYVCHIDMKCKYQITVGLFSPECDQMLTSHQWEPEKMKNGGWGNEQVLDARLDSSEHFYYLDEKN